MSDNVTELTARQKRAVTAMLTARNMLEAAKAAGVAPKTLYRWLENSPAFKAALAEAQNQALDTATRRLLALTTMAADELQDILTGFGGGVKTAERLRAIEIIFTHAVKLAELRDIETRLTVLEAATYAKKHR